VLLKIFCDSRLISDDILEERLVERAKQKDWRASFESRLNSLEYDLEHLHSLLKEDQ
jgi:hypothetical protein